MPILIVCGVPPNVPQQHLEGFVFNLQTSVSNIKALGLDPSEVSVFLPPDLVQLGLGEELICIVKGLFQKPERTTYVRQLLAVSVRDCLIEFARNCVPNCRKVEAIIDRFNQDTDGCTMCNIDPTE